MGGAERETPEGIRAPENSTPELLSLVEAQHWMKLEHEREWRDPDYSHEVLLDVVSEEVPLSEESQNLLAAQVDNLVRTRERVLEVLGSERTSQEILSLAFPEFEESLEPLEMIPTPYSLHFRLKGNDFGRFLRWGGDKKDVDESPTGKVATFTLFSKKLGFPVHCCHEDSLFDDPAPHMMMADYIDTMFPAGLETIDSDRFRTELGYAYQIFEVLTKRDLIAYSALPVPGEETEFVSPLFLSFPSFITAHGQISRNYGEEAYEGLNETMEEFLKIYSIVRQAKEVVSNERLALLIANLEFGEISERLPEAVRLYKEERKRREAEIKAFSHLKVSGLLSVMGGIAGCLVPALMGAEIVFLSALGNDIRRVFKHDKARVITLLDNSEKG